MNNNKLLDLMAHGIIYDPLIYNLIGTDLLYTER